MDKILENKDVFHKEEIYKKNIEPLVKKLKLVCYQNKMPMFVTVATDNDEDGTVYESEMVLAAAEVRPRDNRIAQIVLYMNGLETALPEEVQKALRTIENYRQTISSEDKERIALKLQSNLPEQAKNFIEGNENVTFKNNTVAKEFDENFFDDADDIFQDSF